MDIVLKLRLTISVWGSLTLTLRLGIQSPNPKKFADFGKSRVIRQTFKNLAEVGKPRDD